MHESSPAPPSVLQVCSAPDSGAAEHALALSCWLRDQGWRVAMCCPDSWLSRAAEARGLDVHVLPMPRDLRPRQDLTTMWRLAVLIRRLRVDLVHAHSSKAGGVARPAAVAARTPCVFTPHAWSFLAAGSPGMRRAWVLVERVLARCTRLTVCVSEDERLCGVRAGVVGDRVAVIPNGVRVDIAPRPPAAGHRLGVVARLSPQKGLDVLLQALVLVRPRVPDVTLTVIGEGPSRQELQELAGHLGVADAVTFAGWSDDPTGDLREVDVFVLPSRWEGQSLALLEAGALGLPCVATDVGGAREVIQDGHSGLLVPPEDPAALADALVRVLQDPHLAAALGAAARRAVAHGHDVATMLARTEREYLALLIGHDAMRGAA